MKDHQASDEGCDVVGMAEATGSVLRDVVGWFLG